MVSLTRIIHRMQRNREKGFTLIELMIVVAILGILAAIAIPNFMRFQAKSKQSEAKTNLGAIGTTAEAWRSENDQYIVTAIGDLGWAPQGTSRYSYWYDVGGTDTVFPGGATGTTDGCNVGTTPGTVAVATAATTFTAGAKGQIDTDSTCDEWGYNNLRDLSNGPNDVSG